MKVADIVSRTPDRARPARVAADARLTEAAARLGQPGCGLILVCDGAGRLVGVIGKTDVVARIGHCAGRACTEAVAAVMNTDIVRAEPQENAREAWERMRAARVRSLPVVDAGGRPLAVLSARDLLQALLGEIENEETLLRDYVLGLGYR